MGNLDLDSAMDSLNAMEERDSPRTDSVSAGRKEEIGVVEDFFDKIGVVAINLAGTLSVGDVIEIGDDEEAVRQKVASMQINRENVESAGEGDSVGIKLKYRVNPGLSVYKIR